MEKMSNLQSQAARVAFLSLILAALFLLLLGDIQRPELANASGAALRFPTGQPQLVSVEPWPVSEGQICRWVPTGTSSTLRAMLQQEQTSQANSVTIVETGTLDYIDADRAPVRVIRDTYPTYSAIAVDTNSNEVFLQDENLFGIRVFNRLDNTPPTANFTEPKRLLGGIKTKLEFNCGLYIDPKTGDIYSVPNDTVDRMVVFPRDAQGNVAPARMLHTPHGTYGIAVDEEAQEMYFAVQHQNSVVAYRKMAEGEEKPLRTIQGGQTGLEDPHGVAADSKSQLLFVSNHGHARKHEEGAGHGGWFEPPSITVYPLKANGNTASLRTIEGPKTLLNWPANLFVDPERGELYVANDAGDSILVFRNTDQGDVAPTRIVKGPKTGIRNPTGVFVDLKNNELWVSNMGNHRATVYSRTANGDVDPLRTIRSAPQDKVALAIGNPGAAGYDSKRDEILVPN